MPRVEIPLIGPAYTNRERGLSAQKAINMWPEINPEARNQVALHNGAGLRTFATLEGVDRGMHDFNNLMYAVSGYTLFSIDADGQNTALGSIGGQNRCVMANDSTQLIITTGDTPYRYTVAGGVEAITDPDLVKPTSVAYINNQFVFDNNNGTWGEFVTSSIEPGLSIDSLDFAVAESHPDDIVRIMSFRQLVYFFGTHSVEPWQNTGVGNPPFARLNSGVQPYGLAGTHGVIATNEYMYFLDTKRIPRRSNGLAFPSIGNPALGVEFATYTRIDDVVAFEFVQDNQQFVAFTFPEANKTWCFHEPSGSWWQMTFSGVESDAVWLPPPPTTNPPTPPPQDTDNEIVAPYWENTGTWIDLTALTSTTFATQFGDTVDGDDFNDVFEVEKAALVNTTDAGNRLQIQDSNDCTKAGLYITDASGNVVDSQIYTGVPSGDSVIVPSTGVNHYVVTSSDTTNAKIKKWGSEPASGTIPWTDISGGYEFGAVNPSFTNQYLATIPAEGLSVRFTVPSTTDNVFSLFKLIKPSASGRTINHSVNSTAHDLTTEPANSFSSLDNSITGGINNSGLDTDLVPGQEYFWNIAFDDGATGEVNLYQEWDNASVIPPVDKGDAVSWESMFGWSLSDVPFGDSWRTRAFIREVGTGVHSIWFTIPDDGYVVTMGFYQTEMASGTLLQQNISDVVGDFNAEPMIQGGDTLLTGGVNQVTKDKVLLPGHTYFWNTKWANEPPADTSGASNDQYQIWGAYAILGDA